VVIRVEAEVELGIGGSMVVAGERAREDADIEDWERDRIL
jgi:hypothetical protein